jgi:hypothetical protein
MLSERGQSAGHAHSEQVFKTSSSSVGLSLDTPWTLNATMLTSRRFLDRLRLGPRRHAEHQHLSQTPHLLGQSRRHRWRTRPPHLGRAHPMGGNRLRVRLAQAGVGQDKIITFHRIMWWGMSPLSESRLR